jgi:hypothetical protein
MTHNLNVIHRTIFMLLQKMYNRFPGKRSREDLSCGAVRLEGRSVRLFSLSVRSQIKKKPHPVLVI